MKEMIHVYASSGNFSERTVSSFDSIVQELNLHRRALYECPSEVIIELLDKFGKSIIREPDLITIEGLPYLSLWLRKENLKYIYQINFGRSENFGEVTHQMMFPAPRGIVCHWIAGNIPLLGIFSFVLATLGKNASILKVSPDIGRVLALLMRRLNESSCPFEGVTISGEVISRSTAIVSFPGKNMNLSKQFSLAADCRVIYGSQDAVQNISVLPHQVHSETIIYGPKYSFAIFAKDSISSPHFPNLLEDLARDIILFNQTACSSPHVLFFEKTDLQIRQVAEFLKEAFNRLPARLFHPLYEGTSVTVINTRAQYLLDENKDLLSSSDLAWTICMNNDLSLEEPVQGRCIFLKEIRDMNQVLDLITRKVQTVALCINDEERRREYARELAYRGVDRVMTSGTMHEYTQPWDGILGAGRMIRWIALKK